VAVLRLSSVGDVVLCEPVLAALNAFFPGIEIGFVVKRRFRDLVDAHPAVRRVHALAGSSRSEMDDVIDEIRSVGYDAAIDLHHNARTMRILRCSRIPTVTSYRKREIGDALRVRLLRRPFRAGKLLVERYLEALTPLGVDASAMLDADGRTRRPRLYLSDEHRAGAAAAIERHGLADRAFAALVPGAMWPTKCWPRERYAAVAAGLVSRNGLRVLLLGGPPERALCDEIVRQAGTGVVSAAGETTLGQLGGIIERARVFVGNDSGPTHMAAALGVPTVALFGPTDPGQFDHAGQVALYRDLECSACSFYGGRRCPKGHWACMMGIEPREVLAAVGALLVAGRRPSDKDEGRA
jgi:lipopolysaccharide heptosyltransferase II